MIKEELITAVHDQLGREASRAQAEAAINAVLAAIQTGLKDGGTVQIHGFGSFTVTTREAREGRNPATGESMQIPETRTVRFRPGKNLKEDL